MLSMLKLPRPSRLQAKFQPLKLLFGEKYPEILQYTPLQKADRISRLMGSEEGRVLLLSISESIDQLQEYADDPSIVQNSHLAAHANGGIYALRGLFNKLEAMASAFDYERQKALEVEKRKK